MNILYEGKGCKGDINRISYIDINKDIRCIYKECTKDNKILIYDECSNETCSSCSTYSINDSICMGKVLTQCMNKQGLETIISNMSISYDNSVNITHYKTSNCSGDEIGKIIYKSNDCQEDIMAQCNSSYISLLSCSNDKVIDVEELGACIYKENVYMKYLCSGSFYSNPNIIIFFLLLYILLM